MYAFIHVLVCVFVCVCLFVYLFNRYRAFRRAWVTYCRSDASCYRLINTCCPSGNLWQCECNLGQILVIWGFAGAILALFWRTWGLLESILGYDHEAWAAHSFLKALLEHTVVNFAYKTLGFSMVLKYQHSSDIENAWMSEMPKSLSPYACAAKSLSWWSTPKSWTENLKP